MRRGLAALAHRCDLRLASLAYRCDLGSLRSHRCELWLASLAYRCDLGSLRSHRCDLRLASLAYRCDPLEIVERDDGYISGAPSTGMYFASFRGWPARQRKALRFARGVRALDVGCGAGRVALYLQERGLQVTAVDNSPLAVRTARTRGVDARLLPFQNISRLPRNRFDTVVMPGNNFGLFGGYREAKSLLPTLHSITTDGAILIAESLDPYSTDDAAHLRYQRVNRRRGRMSGQIRIRVRYRECVGPWFDYLLVSRGEMKQILDGTGWKVRRFFKDEGPSYVAVINRI